MKRFDRGFTVLELLVVISIVGLLISTVLVATSKTRVKSRDAKRIQDLYQIRSALELYHSDQGIYPSSSVYGGWAISDSSGCQWIPGLSPEYIPCVPADPINKKNTAGGTIEWPIGPWHGDNNFVYAYLSLKESLSENIFINDYDLVALLEDETHPKRCEVVRYIFHNFDSDFDADGVPPLPDSSWCPPWSNQLYVAH